MNLIEPNILIRLKILRHNVLNNGRPQSTKRGTLKIFEVKQCPLKIEL